MTIDWNKFTNFRSRNARKDLERLLNGAVKSKSRIKDLLERSDKTGLCPIHWAAINNRPDMIETLYEAGSPLAKPCRNQLFADGTPLHLAAMNGCLEAAAMLLAKSLELQNHKTRPKTLASSESSQRDENNNKGPKDSEEETNKLLTARDAEGQTPLMRSAAPRSKRMDTIRDLLRKNFWSLSGRPAEMALFLICMGAEWRHAEPAMGMNLLHLAIVNDHDDIVSLLLALDRSLINEPTASTTINRASGEPTTTDDESRGSVSTSPATSADELTGERPLIDSRSERADELLATGLKPLQLAILYGRVSCINQLWHASQDLQKRPPSKGTNTTTDTTSHVEVQIEAFKNHRQSPSQRELKRILMRACYTNKQELAKHLKPGLLKGALALDLAILALVWAPTYVTWSGLAGGIFIFSYVISMTLGLRVILKNPGYLRRNSVQYLSELARLLESRRRAQQPTEDESHLSQQNGVQLEQSSSTRNDRARQRRKSTAPLIKLEPPSDISRDQTTVKKEKEEQEEEEKKQISIKNDGQKPLVVSVASARMSVNAFRDLQDKVRLFCHKCQCIRRPRSRHCNSCNHCVQDFDHHCIYLGCCVGRYNRLDFLLAMVALTITAIYGTILHSIAMDRERGRSGGTLLHAIGVVWVGKYVLIGGLAAFLIARRACLGITQYEEVRSKRIRRTFGRVGPPEEISNTHQEFSTHRNAFWRYAPDRFLTGELTISQMLANLREFTNYLGPDDYLLTFICTDTPLARSLTSSDWRMKQLYKFV